MRNSDRNKIIFIFLSFGLLFSIVIAKSFYLQVIHKQKLLAYAKSQILRTHKVYPNRGNIYDRNGSPLAINIQTYSIFTIPKNIKNPQSTYKQLASIVPELTLKKINKRVHRREKYTWLERKISLTDEQLTKIKKLDGIYVEAVPKRIYPNKELLSQTLGMVGIDNTGLDGIEYLFDDVLKGRPQTIEYLQDAKGRPIKYETSEKGTLAKDIYLTIDKDIQAVAEKYLKEAVIEYKARIGGIGVMDIKTGEILAIANYPTFDANNDTKVLQEHKKLSYINDPFEPGSVFKPLTVASALENKILTPESQFYCEKGKLKVENHTINESDSTKTFEWLSVSDILKHSSNIGTTKIAFDLTYPLLQKTLIDFKIGDKTGIEIPGESRGIFTEKANVRPLVLSNYSFGQGLATTGIQILMAYATIANDGISVPPTIIKGARKKGTRIISSKTAQELTQMLINVVDSGTGTTAKIPFFQIAGKTGTAQRPIPGGGGYRGHIPSFAGFPVNVDSPFAVFVYLDDPKGKSYYGSAVAGPVFRKVTEYILYKNKDFAQIAEKKASFDADYIDSVQTKNAAPRFIKEGLIPNFIGLDKKSAALLAQKADIQVEFTGIGLVQEQSIAAGEQIGQVTTIKLNCRLPQYE